VGASPTRVLAYMGQDSWRTSLVLVERLSPPSKIQKKKKKKALRLVWGRIRLATLYALWGARTRALQAGQHSTPATVACQVVSSLQSQITGDWVRATTARAQFEGVRRGWLEDSADSTEPVLTVERFAAMWAARGALCAVEWQGGRHVMRMRLSLACPLPLPR
jgi:hypothetical protein